MLSGNGAPVAEADSFITLHDQAIIDDVSPNDYDLDGDPLDFSLVSGPSNGTLTFNSDGTFEYTPGSLFVGQDQFTYEVSDGIDTDQAVATVDVFNSAPSAEDDSYFTLHDQSVFDDVSYNDYDMDGDSLEFSLVSGPTNGSLTFNPDGTFEYTPDPLFVGLDQFTYQASDGIDTDQAIAYIDVSNSAPIAEDDWFSTAQNQVLNADVSLNDYDLDGDPLSFSVVSGPTNGNLTFNMDGTFAYTPDPAFIGQDQFTYEATDGIDSAQAVTYIDVTPGPVMATADVVVAYPDSRSMDQTDLVELTEDGTAIYAADVPFLVTAFLDSNATTSYPLIVQSLDLTAPGAIDFTYNLSPGETFEQVFTVEIGMAASVGLYVAVIDPFVQLPIAEDSESEAIFGLEFDFASFTGDLTLKEDHVAELGESGAEAAAGALIDLLDVQEIMQQTGLTQQVVEARLGEAETYLASELLTVLNWGANAVFQDAKPNWVLRVGQRDPLNTGFSAIIAGMPEALNDGIFRWLEPGEELIDNLDEFITVDWISPGDVFDFVTNDDFKNAVIGYVQDGNSENLNDIYNILGDVEWLSVGLELPFIFDPLNRVGLDGNLIIEADKISFSSGPNAINVNGNLGTTREIPFEVLGVPFAVEAFNAIGGATFDPDDGDVSINVFFGGSVVRP